MVTELKYGQMVPNMKVCGNIIKPTEKVLFGTSMATNTKVIGSRIKHKAKEFTFTQMVPNTTANGTMTFSMVTELRFGQMVANTMVCMGLDANMVSANTIGLMEAVIRAIGLKTRLTAKVVMNGLTVESTREAGLRIIWMGMAFTPGLMEESMKVPTQRIESTVSESTLGLMDVDTKACGRMVVNMDKAFIAQVLMNR